ncbi:MAG: dephospho-CoA kinase [Flavobacteriaceae bacterium]|nr:dephospho-CoA kinase [Flavobacteriaceae bacterium]
MKIIGLTGGIGSGKTTIAKMFEQFGVPIYFSDDEAKKIMTTSTVVKNKLIKEFGEKSFINGQLNREYLANIIFKDKEKLLKINAIVHPEVKKHFKKWVKKQNVHYVIQEHPLLFENKMQDNFDRIITVTAPKELRIKRIISRDKSTQKNALARIENQLEDDYKVENSNYVIQNIDLKQSKIQVFNIHKELLQK